MTNKLVVIINSLKVAKIKKILLYEMKFLVPNYSCLTSGLPSPGPNFLCPLSSTEYLKPSPPPNKIPGYATAVARILKTQNTCMISEINSSRRKRLLTPSRRKWVCNIKTVLLIVYELVELFFYSLSHIASLRGLGQRHLYFQEIEFDYFNLDWSFM